MKKLTSLILVALLMISATVFPAFAENSTDQYLQMLFKHYPHTKEAYEYDELFYTDVGELDIDCDDAIDYAIIFTHFAMAPDAIDSGVIGNRFIWQPQLYAPFRFGYALYDIENDEFIPFSEDILDNYPFLEEYMDKFRIGTPFGDANGDEVLSVMDATFIQRCLAHLDEFLSNDYLLQYGNYPTDYRSDFNLDGSVDILDATGIQMKLASIPEEPLDKNF